MARFSTLVPKKRVILYVLTPPQGRSMGLWPKLHMISPKQMAVSAHLSQASLGQWGPWLSLKYRNPAHQHLPNPCYVHKSLSDDLYLTKRRKALNFCQNKTSIKTTVTGYLGPRGRVAFQSPL